MNPLRLTARNYRSFSDLDVTFPEGCTAVVGPNGAGKSSIVGAIDLALFGARSLGDYLTEGIDEPLQIELEFSHRNEIYRVRRTYSPKGRGQTKLDFERFEGVDPNYEAPWLPLTRETAAATQELICETLGLSRETFRASAFLAQGDGAAFTEAQPRERKAILAEVLGLGIWDELLQLAKADRSRLEYAAQRIRAELELAREESAKRPALEAKRSELSAEAELLVALVATAEDRKQRVEHALGAAEGAKRQIAGAEAALVARNGELGRIVHRIAELSDKIARAGEVEKQRSHHAEWAERVDRLQAELTEAVERGNKRAAFESAHAERKRLLNEAKSTTEEAEQLRALAARIEAEGPNTTACDRCGQQLGKEAFDSYLAKMRADAGSLDATAKQRQEDAAKIELPEYVAATGRSVQDIQPELRLAHLSARKLAELDAQIAAAAEAEREKAQLLAQEEPLRAEVDAARAALALLQNEAPDTAALESERADLQSALTSQRADLDTARQSLAVAEAELKRLEEVAHKIGGSERMLADLQGELDVVLLAERAYGRDGIPALIVENAAIPQIETEANRILAELGTSFTIELRTQRALKSGEGLKESLDIVVAGPIGARPYETFSGGERTRLNLALRIALARLLAHRRGAEVRMLAIDEPEFLDEAGVARLAEVLRGLSADFDRILLVSHVPGLRDAFDQALEVEKVGERSQLVDAPARAEVLA